MISQFVDELPGRVARLKRHLAARDWKTLYRTVHQLKGAAGTYAFEQLVPYALRVENDLTRSDEPRVIAAGVQELIAQCQRVSAGIPQTAAAD